MTHLPPSTLDGPPAPSHAGGSERPNGDAPRERAGSGPERAGSGAERGGRLPPGLFVTGTDTGVGKSVVSAALCAALRAAGRDVAAVKPVLTGLDDEPGEWPFDHELLAAASGRAADAVAPLRFGPAVSPHLAAELAGTPIDPAELLAAVVGAAEGSEVAVVEGVGGLLVPIAPGYSVRELAADLGLPLVVVARPGLGTINHTLLTVEAARAAGLDVRAIVITPWPEDPSTIERSNRETIERLTGIEVFTLPRVEGPDPALLAAAARDLPVGRWAAARADSRSR